MSELSEKLILFNRSRLPEMLQLKYEAMTENAFRYYRGTCHLFYDDLAKAKGFPQSPPAWICGDLHLENYGSYTADNNLVYFDLNDFDESVLAPAAWEVVRMVTSIFVAFDSLDIEPEKAEKMAQLYLKTYATTLVKAKAVSIEPRTAKGIVCDFLTSAAHSKDTAVVKKRTDKKKHKVVLNLDDERHFKIKKTLRLALMEHVQRWIEKSSDSPYNYKVKGAVFRLAGTGSIGVKRYLFLLKSTNTKNKYLFVDMKQCAPSALTPYLKIEQKAWDSEAERVINVQRRMQNVSASLLSPTLFHDEPYILQELQPVKDSINFKLIRDQYRDIYQVIDDMAILTASAQLRSGGMDGSAIIDELKAFGSREDWQEIVLTYAYTYARKVKKDYRQYLKDYRSGKFSTTTNQTSAIES